MKHRSRLLETLKRAEKGPMMDEKDFDRKLVGPLVKKIVKEYGIEYDASCIIPDDNDFTDRLFQAGLQLASEVGLFCQDTSRQILWTREELLEGIRYAPAEAIMGAGSDTVAIKARVPEEQSTPALSGGAYGVVVPESMFVPLMLSYAQEPIIDLIDNPTIETVYGSPIKAASPWEALGGWREAELSMEVINRAGRPGLCLGCVEQSATSLAEISATSYGGFRPTDQHKVATLSEFKTNYDMLTKVVHTTRTGGFMSAYYNPIYGGFAGGAEGVALAMVAGPIILNQTYMGTTYGARPDHPFLGCDTTPELLWSMSSAFQAITSNTNLMLHGLAGPAGGPGTKTILYENAAFATMATVSGVTMIAASMSASGRNPRHASGLDAKICGEVARPASYMTRAEADERIKRLSEIYLPDIQNNPIGKPFEEVYDLETIQPSAEWSDTYSGVKEELIAMGYEMDKLI